MKEKVLDKREFCAVPLEIVNSKIKELVENPASKAVLEEYFMWINIQGSPLQFIDEANKDLTMEDNGKSNLKIK
jgi:hypothetical protein